MRYIFLLLILSSCQSYEMGMTYNVHAQNTESYSGAAYEDAIQAVHDSNA